MKLTKGLIVVDDATAATLYGGEPLTLTLVLSYLAVSVMTVLVWKLFVSLKGKVTLPGGFHFEWSNIYLNPLFKSLP